MEVDNYWLEWCAFITMDVEVDDELLGRCACITMGKTTDSASTSIGQASREASDEDDVLGLGCWVVARRSFRTTLDSSFHQKPPRRRDQLEE
jgi:hypothetical protein